MSMPQVTGNILLTNGGLETCLIYDYHYELPQFAAFPLMAEATTRALLIRYYEEYISMAAELGCGLVLATPTWRCSSVWGAKLGYTEDQIDQFNKDAVGLLVECGGSAVICGHIGPRGDGYVPSNITVQEAKTYHMRQVSALASGGVSFVSGQTFSSWEEAAGMALAAKAVGIPVTVGFTVDTDGRLHSGQELGEAVRAVDQATGGFPKYFTINCAHPLHFRATQLDSGDVDELARQTSDMRLAIPNLAVVGGCCGTRMEHVKQMGRALNRA